ncbi:AI-2E family transporter [Methylocystis sp.]|uniref:AI-2E family transporter n=1 Tax=Methylocystis sp. TaxID=1911079 RepID=UPI003DA5E71B
MDQSQQTQQATQTRLLAIIAFLLVAFALRQTYPVTMPLAAAFVVIAAVWPIKPWLQRYVPETLSNIGTVLVLLAVLAAFAGAISFSVAQIGQAFGENSEKLQQLYERVSAWVQSWGGSLGGLGGYSRMIDLAQKALTSVYNIIAYIGVIGVLVAFGLPEVTLLRKKIGQQLGGNERRELVDAVDSTAVRIRQYLWVTTLTSAITAAATLIWSLALGLDLALVWALLNFLLNYIPVIGNIIGILPPTLYAIVQFDSWMTAAVAFIGFSIIQIVISNFIAPTLQGQRLSLTPMAVIVSLSVWTWIWGIAGALIAVPLTSALIILCKHFPSVRWIAMLLSDDQPESAGSPEEVGGVARRSAP